MAQSPEAGDRHRIDKWLWQVRLFKTRSLAADAVTGGKVKVEGGRVKPAHQVRIGQRVAVTLVDRSIEVEILALPIRRGPAPEAQACYLETPASAERSVRHLEAKRLAAFARPRSDHRPDKRERRQLESWRRRQSG